MINIAPEILAAYEEHGHQVTIDAERLTAMCVKEAPKAKYSKIKVVYNYRYRSEERLVEHVTGFITDLIANKVARAKFKAERAAAKKAQLEEIAEAIKVGTILVNSWGYDQTNVDAYEVIAKPSPKTVVIREIALRTVKDSEGHMSDTVMPVAGAFIGEAEKRRITAYGVTTQYGTARPAEAGKTFYRSWYA